MATALYPPRPARYIAHPLPDSPPDPMVEAVGVSEDLGVDLLMRDPVIDAVEDRRSRLDGAELGAVSKTFPDTGRDALPDAVLDEEPVSFACQNGHQLTRPIAPVDVLRRRLPGSLIGLPR